ncbi:pyridoxamine 5'-phosphate oxidase family protein [Paenibacillus cymbidii]|uniref:pyridoxamine 5'-phosphate oxidase family protein n=1 Tax=Paenibacillus cymbidii TaxID=1639034 RepID=UPI001082306A|nr:pyridoxamine 5'-phosphate oxidase family protein [Paenibacillus cymbidii]
MRRKEFSVEESAEVEQFLAGMTFGFLGTIDMEGWPHITPLNFVYEQGNVYFHGSKVGDKMKEIKHSDRVTFAVAKEYALIPSYYTDPKLACPATAFFKSVHMRGKASIVTDLSEKAAALTAFMRKLQPEGGYATITTEDADYAGQLKSVAVVKIEVEELTAKFKFGQNWQETQREHVATKLEQRGQALDAETAALMRQYCPAHRE